MGMILVLPRRMTGCVSSILKRDGEWDGKESIGDMVEEPLIKYHSKYFHLLYLFIMLEKKTNGYPDATGTGIGVAGSSSQGGLHCRIQGCIFRHVRSMTPFTGLGPACVSH